MIARILVIPFVIAGLMLSARPSLACSCVYAPTEVGPFADVVFTGVARAYSTENRVERYVVVEFHVGTVHTGRSGTSSGTWSRALGRSGCGG